MYLLALGMMPEEGDAETFYNFFVLLELDSQRMLHFLSYNFILLSFWKHLFFF